MTRTKRNETEWHQLAVECARDACENHFDTRRGMDLMEDGVVCLFNNHPYAKFPSLRDEETAEFRRRLAEEGSMAELAYATYPPEGEEDAGYTYAMLIQLPMNRTIGPDDPISWIQETMEDVIAQMAPKAP
jgi:hypothetical protein